ncbi:MAG: TonB-dependent receptor [Bacteroidota bacterium]
MKQLLLTTILMGGLILAVQAQSPDVDTVMISSQRIPQTVSESGRDILVIDGDMLQDLPVNSIDELLRYLPGVNVQSRGGFGSQGDISMRGSTFAQVLMLVDGVRINDPLTGHFNNYLPISPAEISRIEVVYGPSAALYGPDAVGGVINIITHNFEGKERTDAFGTAQLGGGQFGLLNTQIGGGVPTKIGYLNAGVQFNRATGQSIFPDSAEIKNDFNIRTASISLRKDLGDYSFSIRAASDFRLFNARYYYTTSTFDYSREQVNQFWTQGRIAKKWADGLTTLDLAYKQTKDSFLFNPDFPANLHTTRFGFAQLNHQHNISSQLKIAAGFQADLRDIVSSDRGEHSNVHFGLYATSLWSPTQALTINGSLRLDQDNNYGLEVSPQIGISYRLQPVTLRLLGGRGIRAADFTERFIASETPILSPGRNLGNPDLEAERAWSVEGGIDLNFVEGLKISSTVFYRYDNNLIDYGLVNSNDIPNNGNLQENAEYLLAQNLLAVESLGLETQAHYKKVLGDVQLDILLGNQLIQTVNPTAGATKYVSNRPRFLFSGQIIGRYKLLSLSIQHLTKIREGATADVIGAELQDQYSVWNGKVQVHLLNDKLSLYGQVYNLGNLAYQDILGAVLPQRWLLGGIMLNL